MFIANSGRFGEHTFVSRVLAEYRYVGIHEHKYGYRSHSLKAHIGSDDCKDSCDSRGNLYKTWQNRISYLSLKINERIPRASGNCFPP